MRLSTLVMTVRDATCEEVGGEEEDREPGELGGVGRLGQEEGRGGAARQDDAGAADAARRQRARRHDQADPRTRDEPRADARGGCARDRHAPRHDVGVVIER
jgi:hypothetical protein